MVLLIIGTFFYHFVEGWSYVDSFYFSAISLSTRGYGELHPSYAISKIFTVFYLFVGVALILYALSTFIGYYVQYHEQGIHKKVNSIVNHIAPRKKERWLVLKAPSEDKGLHPKV